MNDSNSIQGRFGEYTHWRSEADFVLDAASIVKGNSEPTDMVFPINKFPVKFSPYVRLKYIRTEADKGVQTLVAHMGIFASTDHVLDDQNPIKVEYTQEEALIFVNFIRKNTAKSSQNVDTENEEEKGQKFCFFSIRYLFERSFYLKMRGKQLFVVPVHDDPEEGEISKTKVDEEEEIDV